MQIFVDADACPVVGIVEKVAKEHNVPVTLLCDINIFSLATTNLLRLACLSSYLLTMHMLIF